jgi:hypothetical protein
VADRARRRAARALLAAAKGILALVLFVVLVHTPPPQFLVRLWLC